MPRFQYAKHNMISLILYIIYVRLSYISTAERLNSLLLLTILIKQISPIILLTKLYVI